MFQGFELNSPFRAGHRDTLTDRGSDGIHCTRGRCDMKKLSLASSPTLFDLGLYSKDESESTVVCKGQTAKLHSRNGGLQDEKQVSVMENEFIYITVNSMNG